MLTCARAGLARAIRQTRPKATCATTRQCVCLPFNGVTPLASLQACQSKGRLTRWPSSFKPKVVCRLLAQGCRLWQRRKSSAIWGTAVEGSRGGSPRPEAAETSRPKPRVPLYRSWKKRNPAWCALRLEISLKKPHRVSSRLCSNCCIICHRVSGSFIYAPTDGACVKRFCLAVDKEHWPAWHE